MSQEMQESVKDDMWEPTELTPPVNSIVAQPGYSPKTFKIFKNKGPFDKVEILGSSLGFTAGKLPSGVPIIVTDVTLEFPVIEKLNDLGVTLPISAVLEVSESDSMLATKIGITNLVASDPDKAYQPLLPRVLADLIKN